MAALFLSGLDLRAVSFQRAGMLAAIIVFVPLAALLLLAELKLLHAAQVSELQAWMSVHLYLPLIRAAALLLFIFIAHPELYGLRNVSSLGSLLTNGHYRFDQLVNLSLLVSLLLPLLPLVNRVAGVTLALQGVCATALVASWMAADAGVTITLLPDIGLVLRMVALLAAARLVAELLARELIRQPGYRDIAVEAARMTAQLPAVIIYARYLGVQLGG